MVLSIRLLHLKRRAHIREYVDDVRETLCRLRDFASSGSEWREASPAQSVLPLDQEGLERLLTERPVRNNVGHVMEDMGYSLAAFLDAKPPRDIYVSLDLGVRSPHTEENVTCDIPAEVMLHEWEPLIELFCDLIVRWSPEFADVMNSRALDVISDDLGERLPVGFACYGAGVPLIEAPEFAKAKEVGEGSILYLECPKFDLSREEGARLRAISDLFLIANERYR